MSVRIMYSTWWVVVKKEEGPLHVASLRRSNGVLRGHSSTQSPLNGDTSKSANSSSSEWAGNTAPVVWGQVPGRTTSGQIPDGVMHSYFPSNGHCAGMLGEAGAGSTAHTKMTNTRWRQKKRNKGRGLDIHSPLVVTSQGEGAKGQKGRRRWPRTLPQRVRVPSRRRQCSKNGIIGGRGAWS